MIGDTSRRWWLPLAGATVALALALTACGDDAATASTAAAPSTSAAPGTSAAVDPPPALVEALDAVGERYAFTATITVGGAEATRVEGTVYDGAGSYVVITPAGNVDYVISPEGQWARQEGAEWAVLGGPAPLAEPLAPLANPLSVVTTAVGTIAAVYDGASLGFADGGEVLVTITIRDGAVAELSYETSVGDSLTQVVTTFDPTANLQPIQVPPG